MKTSNKIFCCAIIGAWLGTVTAFGDNEWWVKSAFDAQWTNKPLSVIQDLASRGDPTGQLYYARHFFLTAEGSPNRVESFKWVTRAAEAGLADARVMKARFHFAGVGTIEDPVTGHKWANLAATQGHPDGLALLADSFANGRGTRLDVAKAKELFQRSIDGGSILGLDWLGHFYLSGEARTARRTNYVEALRCFERAASNGMAHAAAHVIGMYASGLGTVPNLDRAILWARAMVDQNEMEPAVALAGFYSDGLAEPRDSGETPTVLFRRVLEAQARTFERDDSASMPLKSYFGLVGTCRNLWNRYRFGIGTPRDYIAAAQWMLVAYRQDVLRDRNRALFQDKPVNPFEDVSATAEMGLSREERLWQEALRKINSALEQSQAGACREIGLGYRDGSDLTPQDSVLACAWLSRAVDLNEPQARIDLAELERALGVEQINLAKSRFIPRCKLPR